MTVAVVEPLVLVDVRVHVQEAAEVTVAKIVMAVVVLVAEDAQLVVQANVQDVIPVAIQTV